MRVVIIDGQDVVRQGVRTLLAMDRNIDVVGEANSGEAGVALVLELKPDVVLMDILMPGMGGIVATTLILRQVPTTQVIAFSDAMESKRVVGMIRAGAIGYLPKAAEVDDLYRAIHAAATGRAHLAPAAATLILEAFRAPEIQEPLSAREIDVLKFLVKGTTNKEIASALHITAETVKCHMVRISAKLGVKGRVQIALFAMRLGLGDPSDETLADEGTAANASPDPTDTAASSARSSPVKRQG